MLKAGESVRLGGRAWRVENMVGQGRCCEVYRATDTATQHQFAVKIYKPGENYVAACKREVSLLEILKARGNLGHHLVETVVAFQHAGHEVIVQELLDSNLREVIHKASDAGLSMWAIQKFTSDILTCLSGLHVDGFIHGDVKPANLQWCPTDSCLKLIDYGLSFHREDQNLGVVQSPTYQAPESKFWNEVHPGVSSCDTALDMWGVGCVLVEGYTQQKLFPHTAHISSNMCDNCMEGSVPGGPCLYQQEADRSLIPRPDMDPPSLTAFNHFKHMVLSIIQCDGSLRLDAATALKHPFMAQTLEPKYHDLILLPTCVLRLTNMYGDQVLRNTTLFKELVEDIQNECESVGPVKEMTIPQHKPVLGNVYIQFEHCHHCSEAYHKLSFRTFNDRTVVATFYPHHLLDAGILY